MLRHCDNTYCPARIQVETLEGAAARAAEMDMCLFEVRALEPLVRHGLGNAAEQLGLALRKCRGSVEQLEELLTPRDWDVGDAVLDVRQVAATTPSVVASVA